MSEKTTRQVILVVLAMLFSVPLFTPTTYIDEPNSYDFGLSLVFALGPNTEAGQRVFNDTVRIQSSLNQAPLVRLYVNTNITYQEDETAKEKSNSSSEPRPVVLEWGNEEVDLSLLRPSEKEIQ